MACEKDIIDISIALLTPVIAILGAYIAFQQWRTNSLRLKHELFEKRYKIFEATKTYIGSVLTHGTLNHEDAYKFLTGTKGALFLFDDSIVEYLEHLHKQGIKLIKLVKAEEFDKEHELFLWFNSEINKIDSVFKEYLRLKY